MAPQSNVSYTFLVRDCHYVAAGNNPTIEHVTKSDSLSASGESGSSLDNQGIALGLLHSVENNYNGRTHDNVPPNVLFV